MVMCTDLETRHQIQGKGKENYWIAISPWSIHAVVRFNGNLKYGLLFLGKINGTDLQNVNKMLRKNLYRC